jgi:hypothetical protein
LKRQKDQSKHVYKIGRSYDAVHRSHALPLDTANGKIFTVASVDESRMEAALKKLLEKRLVKLTNNLGQQTSETFALTEKEHALVRRFFSLKLADGTAAKNWREAFKALERSWNK